MSAQRRTASGWETVVRRKRWNGSEWVDAAGKRRTESGWVPLWTNEPQTKLFYPSAYATYSADGGMLQGSSSSGYITALEAYERSECRAGFVFYNLSELRELATSATINSVEICLKKIYSGGSFGIGNTTRLGYSIGHRALPARLEYANWTGSQLISSDTVISSNREIWVPLTASGVTRVTGGGYAGVIFFGTSTMGACEERFAVGGNCMAIRATYTI